MPLLTLVQRTPDFAGRRLTGVYGRWTLWYLLGLALASGLGIEAIYGHPTPFYDAFLPAFKTIDIPLFAIAAILAARVLLGRALFPGETRRSWSVTIALACCALAVPFVAVFRHATIGKQPLAGVLADDWALLRWHVLALAVFALAIAALVAALRSMHWFDDQPSPKAVNWTIAALVAFSFLFPGAIAMLRDGPKGITCAYDRYTYEYISDIGKGGSIHGLFRDYVKMHPYLSMHAKVHPPGPIVLLWILSLFFGQDAMSLSLATMAVGALGVVPLFWWTRDLTSTRVGLTCALMYAVVPSIVLFTATSADILFTPFTFLTLFCFGRAMARRSAPYALAAGALYALLSLTSFSLISLGGYFGLMGLWKLAKPETRGAVIQTALLMIGAFLAVQFAVRVWSGFNIVDCFAASQAQFNRDQFELDQKMPRFPSWTWKFLNPLCWVYFAGIPVTVLFLARLRRPEAATRALFIVFALTLLILDALYVARGEGERSAMYVFPFMVLPAAHALDEIGARTRSLAPLAATLSFLAFQCWLTESYFYTYW